MPVGVSQHRPCYVTSGDGARASPIMAWQSKGLLLLRVRPAHAGNDTRIQYAWKAAIVRRAWGRVLHCQYSHTRWAICTFAHQLVTSVAYQLGVAQGQWQCSIACASCAACKHVQLTRCCKEGGSSSMLTALLSTSMPGHARVMLQQVEARSSW